MHTGDKMKRNIKIILHFWRIAIQRNLVFRWQFVLHLFGSSISVFFTLFTFHIAYSHTQEIGGWNKYQTILLVGVFQLYTILSSIFLNSNMRSLTRTVYMGELDGLLLRPVSAQLILSLRSINITRIISSIPGFCVIGYALIQMNTMPTVQGILLGIIMLLSGLVIVYALWFISLTLEFWFSGLWSWADFVPNIFEFARYPGGIYKGTIKFLFLTVAPVVVLANFPTRAILGDLAWLSALYSLCLAGVLLLASRLQWRWALRHYASASS